MLQSNLFWRPAGGAPTKKLVNMCSGYTYSQAIQWLPSFLFIFVFQLFGIFCWWGMGSVNFSKIAIYGTYLLMCACACVAWVRFDVHTNREREREARAEVPIKARWVRACVTLACVQDSHNRERKRKRCVNKRAREVAHVKLLCIQDPQTER